MPIAQLSIDLVAKIAEFEKDLKRATTATQQQTAAMTNSFGLVGSAVKGLASAFSVGFAINFVKQTIDSVDALNDFKDATGGSIENASALEDIAARTGTSFDSVTTAVVKFNGVLKDTKPGSDAAKAFEALGLNVAELRQLDPAEALLKTAVAFSTFADDGHKARIMQELFSKSLKEVGPFLKDLAEKGQLVATVTAAQADEAEKFNKQLFAMQKNVQDLSREITGPLIKAFNDFIDKQKEAKKEGKFGLFTSPLESGQAAEKRANANYTGSWNEGNAGRGVVNPASVRASLPDLGDGTKTPKSKKSGKDQIDDESRALGAYVESLQHNLEAVDKLTASEKALNFLRGIGATGEIAQVRELVLGMAAQIDKEKELDAVMKMRRESATAEGDAVAKANDEYQALLARLYAATPTMNLEAQRKDVLALTEEYEAGRISEQLYLEAVTARLDLTAEKTDKAKTAAEEFGMTMASAFEDAIVGGKDLSAVLDGLGQDILKMTIRKAVTDPLSSFISSSITSFLPTFDGGGSTGSGSRSGGLDGKGGFMALLHPKETVLDHTRGQSSNSQPITVVQNFTVGDVASISTVRQAVANSERRIAAAFGRNAVYGGGV